MTGNTLQRSVLIGGLLVALCLSPAFGQRRRKRSERNAATVVAVADTKSSESKPGSEAKKDEAKSDEKKPDGENGKDGEEKKEADSSSVVKRPAMKPSDPKAAPIKDEVIVDGDGQVTFNLKGQQWETVLDWLADSSNLTFDWQELPGDVLNLTTARSYSLSEARDIINRHLLARGYTLVLYGEFLSVQKLSDVNMSLVPRVKPEELEELPDHTLCKVSFDLNWLIADEAVTELQPLLSSAGKINKLSRTNRLEVMDTAASLRDIYRILNDEQSDTGQEQLVQNFQLKFRRAGEVIVLLRDLLGIDQPPGAGGPGGGGAAAMGQMASVMKQMTQQLQRMGNSASKGGAAGGEPIKTRLVLNSRENVILATAAPDQMAIIRKAVKEIDVPVENGEALRDNAQRVQMYRLETVDPQTLVDLLQEVGNLSPETVLKVQAEDKTILASASIADHFTIANLIDRVDQSGRDVQVIRLRRLEADYVAGTIRALMLPPEKKESNRGYFSRYSSSQASTPEEKKFKVEADIEHNRLLIYANKVEMDEIYLLLQKLGEIPDPNAADNGFRVFDLQKDENARDVFNQLKRLWGRENELRLSLPPEPREVPEQKDKNTPDEKQKLETDASTAINQRSLNTLLKSDKTPATLSANEFFSLAASGHSAASSSSQMVPINSGIAPARQRLDDVSSFRSQYQLTMHNDKPKSVPNAPVQFSVTRDGRLVVSSDDSSALLQAEDLLKEILKPPAKYEVFNLKYQPPFYVTISLEEYFDAEKEEETKTSVPYWWDYQPDTSTKKPNSLGQRRMPTFIYDNYTSTILVRDADRRQLQTIRELIKIYDAPNPGDSRAARVYKTFRLKNAKADVVAQAVKDVFRDLLSENDKSLESSNGKDEKGGAQIVHNYRRNNSDDEDAAEEPVRFKGLLSIGIDPGSDTLVVSSQAVLMDTVTELILELDRAADTTSAVRVVKLDSSVDLLLIQERLSKALGTTAEPPEENQEKPEDERPNKRREKQINDALLYQ